MPACEPQMKCKHLHSKLEHDFTASSSNILNSPPYFCTDPWEELSHISVSRKNSSARGKILDCTTHTHTQECLVLFEWVFFLHLRLWFIIKTASRTWVNKHITFDSSISQSWWKRHSWGWKPTLNTTWSWTSGVEIWITADHTGHWNRARASCFIHPPPCATLFLEQHQGYKLAQITVWGLLLCLLSDCEGCDQLSHSWADQASRGSQWVW